MTSLVTANRSPRMVALAVIAGLHALVIYLVASGLMRTTVQVLMGSSIAEIIQLPPKADQPPPLPPPHFVPAVVDPVLPPLVPVDFPTDDGGTAITPTFTEVATVPAAQPAPAPIHLVGRHRLPNTEEYYPAAKIREGIEGTSTVRVCVDANGKRAGEPTVESSSGDAGLDQGALHVLRDGRYARAMQGDQYVPNCYAFRIIFKVNNK
jgi:protein TonB